MKTQLLALACLVASAACSSQAKPSATPPPDTSQNTLTDADRAAGWRLLFDGKTTSGWRNYGKPTISDGWKAQAGTLTRGGGGGGIITTAPFRDFQVTDDSEDATGGNK